MQSYELRLFFAGRYKCCTFVIEKVIRSLSIWDEKKNTNCKMSNTWKRCVQKKISKNYLAKSSTVYWKAEAPPDIFVLFSRKFINHIPTPNPEDVWCLCLRSPEDIFQLDAILAILKEEHKKSKLPHIFHNTSSFARIWRQECFADWIKSHIQSKYKYTILKNELEYNALVYKHKDKDWNISKQDRGSVVFWKKFCALPLFFK